MLSLLRSAGATRAPGRSWSTGDAGHLDAGQPLPVPLALVVAGLALELVNPDLRTLAVTHQLTGDRDAGELLGVGDHPLTVYQENRGQGHRIAGLPGELLDLDHVTLGDPVLLAAGLDDRVHGTRLLSMLRCREGTHKARRTPVRRRLGYDMPPGAPTQGPPAPATR